MSYIPSNTLDRKDCEALHKEKVSEEGEYVLKVITYDQLTKSASLKEVFFAWRNEVKVLTTLNKLQTQYKLVFSPILYDAWYLQDQTKVYFYILTERYTNELPSLVEHCEDKGLILSMALRTLEAYLVIIHHSCHISLNHISLQTMRYKEKDIDRFTLVFTEFGDATIHPTDAQMQNDRDQLDRFFR